MTNPSLGAQAPGLCPFARESGMENRESLPARHSRLSNPFHSPVTEMSRRDAAETQGMHFAESRIPNPETRLY